MCSQCQKTFDDKNEAQKCCVCVTCNKYRAWGGGSYCERCTLKSNIKIEETRLSNAKKNVKIARKVYESFIKSGNSLTGNNLSNTKK